MNDDAASTPGAARHRGTSALAGLCGIALVAAVATAPAAAEVPAASAAKRGKPQLVVRSISKPPKASAPGDRVRLVGKVRNRGRKPGRGQLRLIIPSEAGASGGRPLAKKFSKRVRPGKDRRFRFRFQVPGGLAPAPGGADASYPIAACVRRHGGSSRFRCRESGRPLVIAAGPGPTPLPPQFDPGSRSIGDPLFPQVGNGGYDVSHYAIDLRYDPNANRFLKGTRTTIAATATQDLGQFSLDFQNLDVSSVQVDGVDAFFSQRDATPKLAGATQPMKLIVDPPAGIEQGAEFEVRVDYTGTPVELTDPDGSSEGWVRACVGVPTPLTCDGSLVVNEPNGAQGWFPANNHPRDKATIETRITAPSAKSAIGIGELQSRAANGDGTRTWIWTEDDPTATYLTTATVGDFDYTESTLQETAIPRILPVYEAIDSDATPVQRNQINGALGESEGMINFLAGIYGSYPFDSAGAVVDNVPTLGYALEVQTRPHFATLSVDVGTLLHEYAHQWFGNTVSPASWLEIWFNEGWAHWSTWHWESETQAGTTPAEHFDDEYANASAEDWSIPPATLDGDPANLFAHFPTYVRGAMTLEGYRQIVGDERFFQFARELQSRHAYGDVSTAEVIALAEEISGFDGAKLELLGKFFQQWLYGDVKPTILPAAFA